MSDTYAQFEKRINGVTRRHKAMASGYTAEITNDGLITLTPKPSLAFTRLRGFAVVLASFFAIKITVMVMAGAGTYQNRVDELAAGTWFEQLGAVIMQPGVISGTVAQFILSITG